MGPAVLSTNLIYNFPKKVSSFGFIARTMRPLNFKVLSNNFTGVEIDMKYTNSGTIFLFK